MTEPWGIQTSREHKEKQKQRGCRKLERFKPVKDQGTKGMIGRLQKDKGGEAYRWNSKEAIYAFAGISFSSEIHIDFRLYSGLKGDWIKFNCRGD